MLYIFVTIGHVITFLLGLVGCLFVCLFVSHVVSQWTLHLVRLDNCYAVQINAFQCSESVHRKEQHAI